MEDSEKKNKKGGFSLDWLVGGILTKIGDTVDRVTGRGWNPSSSLATSKLVEKIKFLLDEEVRDLGPDGKFAPHVLTLKMQWNKFADDSEGELEKLRNELHAATIDHINDRLYHTYAPIEIKIKTDYFTEGVRLIGSFGKFGDADEEAVVNVTLPKITVEHLSEGTRASIDLSSEDAPVAAKPSYKAVYEINGKRFEKVLDFEDGNRYSVGRVKENDIALDHQSVSKVHASIVLSGSGKLLVADMGSTNGTYIDEQRIAYGKAIEVPDTAGLRFGSVEIELVKRVEPEVQTEVLDSPPTEYAAPATTPAADLETEAPLPLASAESEEEVKLDTDWEAFPDPADTSAFSDSGDEESKEEWEI